MNNIFDIKRFGNYFLYDLRNAKNNYGLSLLLMGMTPIILTLAYFFIGLIGRHGLSPMPEGTKFSLLFVVLTVTILTAGTKIYGHLTEKQAGSNFILLPASTFEKWLSMSLVVCIVLPIVLFVLLLVSDALTALAFPAVYGGRLLDLNISDIVGSQEVTEGLFINIPAILFLSWSAGVLSFTLGGICFKKAKVAKSFLCLMGIGMLFSLILVLLVSSGNFDFSITEESFSEDPYRIISIANWSASIFYAVSIIILLAGIWLRLRTLKH